MEVVTPLMRGVKQSLKWAIRTSPRSVVERLRLATEEGTESLRNLPSAVLFNSWQFLFFFPVFLLLYYPSPAPLRRWLLLVGSCLFYMAFIPAYILILWVLIAIDFGAGLLLESSTGTRKAWILAVSLASNLGILGFFKYWNFLALSLNQWLGLETIPLHSALLPIGLSFHTFQSMAYTIEVYQGKFKAERNLLTYSLYVLFFPQMVAGPIERPAGLLRQLKVGSCFSEARIRSGLRLILLGFLKKILIADRLAPFVSETYAHPHDFLGPRLWLATLFFSVQIYCDFSGYSDIAAGIARLLGYQLIENFRRPYSARGLGEFWRRWHISLSSWFRDYLYIPLGGGRCGPARKSLNLLTVFALSGLWHGANWTFLVWGLWHGLGVCLENLLQVRLPWLLTFLWVQVGWVFFRASDLSSACYILIGGGWGASLEELAGEAPLEVLCNLILVVALLVYQIVAERSSETIVAERPWWERQMIYLLMALAIVLVGRWSSNEFLYFQF